MPSRNKRKNPPVEVFDFEDPNSIVVEAYSFTTSQSAPLSMTKHSVPISSLVDIPRPTSGIDSFLNDIDYDSGIKFDEDVNEVEPLKFNKREHKVSLQTCFTCRQFTRPCRRHPS